jgi:Rrf2 family protein
MRLEVTRRADLATRALLALDGRSGRLKASELADALDASAGFVSQAMTPLVNRGWVRSDPGPTGGYTATVPLAELSVLDVIEAVDGPTDAAACVLEDRPCAGGAQCALHQAWARARGQLLHELASTSLATIATTKRVR